MLSTSAFDDGSTAGDTNKSAINKLSDILAFLPIKKKALLTQRLFQIVSQSYRLFEVEECSMLNVAHIEILFEIMREYENEMEPYSLSTLFSCKILATIFSTPLQEIKTLSITSIALYNNYNSSSLNCFILQDPIRESFLSFFWSDFKNIERVLRLSLMSSANLYALAVLGAAVNGSRVKLESLCGIGMRSLPVTLQ